MIRDSEAEYCQKMGLRPYRHCAHPRSAAAFTVLSECVEGSNSGGQNYPTMDYVVDCTLGYARGDMPSLGETMLGEWPNNTSTVAIHYKVHKIERKWTQDETALREWLYERYKAKVNQINFVLEIILNL